MTEGILKEDYPGNEFYVGGKIIKDMTEQKQSELASKAVTLDRSPQRLLATVTARILGKENGQ